MENRFDLMLKGGEVVDPAQGIQGVRDVAFKDGKVATVSERVDPAMCDEVVDVRGKLVTPGLIDLHGHFAYRISPGRADPDPTNLAIGVTTAIDAGSTGWMNFPGFRSYVIEKVDTRLLAFIHLSSIGTMPGNIQIPDLEDFRYARSEEAMRCIEENRDLVLGMKVRLTPNGTTLKNSVPALEMARGICDETSSTLMVHVMESPIPLAKVFQHMKPGDVATHIFHGDVHNVLNRRGRVSAEVWEAYENGVVFDTACFAKHFAIPICRQAIEEGLLPHTLSTDRVGDCPPAPALLRYCAPYAPKNYNLLEVMSIFLGMEMSLEQVIERVTSKPASVIGREELGSLRVGSVGDAAVLELEEGRFSYPDMLGDQVEAERRFAPSLTIKDGRRWVLEAGESKAGEEVEHDA